MIELLELGSEIWIISWLLCLGYENLFLNDNDRLLICIKADFAEPYFSLFLADNCKENFFAACLFLLVEFLQLVHFFVLVKFKLYLVIEIICTGGVLLVPNVFLFAAADDIGL
jgi:hypothetical protein